MPNSEKEFRLKKNSQELEIKDLKSRNSMQKHILQSFAGIYWWKDKEGVYKDCNDKLAISLGLNSPKDIIGKTDYELPWQEEADILVKHDSIVIESGKTLIKEEPVRGASGELKVFLVTKTPLKDSKGETIGTVGNSVDITKQKYLESKLKKAIKKSEKANEAKSEFIANMSHDIRTPMAGVVGMLSEFKDIAKDIINEPRKSMELATDAIEAVSVGEKSAKEVLRFFTEILDSIKLESGSISKTPENFTLSKVIERNINLLGASAEQKGISLSLEIDEDFPRSLYGLRLPLDRVLTNLLSNAIKFTEKGEINISVKLTSVKTYKVGDEVKVQIRVRDTGIGIAEDKLEDIFGNFYKVTASYQGVYEGYGLGLYAVKKYIENMKGTISVESELDKGSCFSLDIPFVASNHVTQEEEIAAHSEKTDWAEKNIIHEKESGEEGSVLVTEDSMPAAFAIMSALKRKGCSVDHAKTGEEAVSMAKANKYDVILMDIGLPGISGLEAAKEVRRFSTTPMIALTGHVDKEGICLEAGMQGLMVKPANPTQLDVILHKYIFSGHEEEPNLRPEIIDWNCCVKMLDDSEAIAKEILLMCSEDLDISMGVITKAYEDNDIQKLRKELHKIRGGVCYLKLPQLERVLKDFHITTREHPQEPKEIKKHYGLLLEATRDFQETFRKGNYCKA